VRAAGRRERAAARLQVPQLIKVGGDLRRLGLEERHASLQLLRTRPTRAPLMKPANVQHAAPGTPRCVIGIQA
jgi:hypothetical protein